MVKKLMFQTEKSRKKLTEILLYKDMYIRCEEFKEHKESVTLSLSLDRFDLSLSDIVNVLNLLDTRVENATLEVNDASYGCCHGHDIEVLLILREVKKKKLKEVLDNGCKRRK